MRLRIFLVTLMVLAAGCAPHTPAAEAPGAVIPNLPLINPARPVTEETLTTLETDFRRAAEQAVVPYLERAGYTGERRIEARIIRLFSKEKVLWVEMKLGPWWYELDELGRHGLFVQFARLLWYMDERTFNQKRDVILTVKDAEGRRLGDATATLFSTNVRMSPLPAREPEARAR